MIIDRTEKNRILKLYGLINENNIIYEQTTTLTKDTEFDVSGSGTNWVITYKASDDKYYPLSGLEKSLDRKFKKYAVVFMNIDEPEAREELTKLKTELGINTENEKTKVGNITSISGREKEELLAKIGDIASISGREKGDFNIA
jgi:hypothetical protein